MFRRLIVVLALVVWMPSNGWALGFDFALDAFQVSGNATFFDDFNDGNRNTLPTSLLDDRGGTVTTESGGFLILTDTDGADSQDTPFGTVLSDIVVLLSMPIPDGGSSTSIVSGSFRPDIPETFSNYGVGLFGPPTVNLPSISFDKLGGNLRISFRGLVGGGTLGFDSVSVATVTGNVILQITIDHLTDLATPRYSIDGGVTFIEAGSWTDPPSALPVTGGLAPFAAAQALIPEPSTALLLGFGLAAMAVGRRRRV